MATYGLDLAEAKSGDIGDDKDGTADDKRNGRPDVELIRPQR